MNYVDNVRKLIVALRSGKYEQGYGVLRTFNNKFCCLGVACDISGMGEWRECDTNDGWEYVTGEYADETMPPLPVSQAFFPHETNGNPFIKVGDYGDYATNANDNGYSFEEIADALERKYFPDGIKEND